MKVNKHAETIKYGLFCLFVFLWLLPVMQQKTKIVPLKSLNGSFKKVNEPVFSLKGWFEGKYQPLQQSYLNQNVGFRSFFVRLYNQLHFTLYNQAKANGVIVGKDNYLYEKGYIDAYLGDDFIGEKKIREKARKLESIKDTLNSKGIDLIVLLAPGKASFYPEFIPDRFDPTSRTTTNYEVYQDEIVNRGIHLLDFHSWFRKMKNSALYPLFPKTGTHWSRYSEILVADSVINFINSIQQEDYNTPQFQIKGDIEVSTNMLYADEDIEMGMNLLFDIKDLPMAYAKTKILIDSTSSKARVLTIGDSFFWGMYQMNCSKEAFNNGQFWYYNRQIHPKKGKTPINVKDINIIEEVESNDAVILLATDASLDDFAYGFIERLYNEYFGIKDN